MCKTCFVALLLSRDNKIGEELTKLMMKVQMLRNNPRNVYVDDGLASCSTDREATDLRRKMQDPMKQYGNLRLHKMASNSEEAMKAFEPQDWAYDGT